MNDEPQKLFSFTITNEKTGDSISSDDLAGQYDVQFGGWSSYLRPEGDYWSFPADANMIAAVRGALAEGRRVSLQIGDEYMKIVDTRDAAVIVERKTED